nr:cupin domain-containing protein [Planosporangium flavigriseum]
MSVWQSTAPTSTGIWECDPGEFTASRDGYSEICTILSGSGTVVGEDGVSADIGPGSLLVLPMGWRGTWVIKEKMRKTYVMIKDAATVESDNQ